ncbi:MAG: hypothetical protein ACTS4U_01220 [Candidatus Hodgkinia cicadicola]
MLVCCKLRDCGFRRKVERLKTFERRLRDIGASRRGFGPKRATYAGRRRKWTKRCLKYVIRGYSLAGAAVIFEKAPAVGLIKVFRVGGLLRREKMF